MMMALLFLSINQQRQQHFKCRRQAKSLPCRLLGLLEGRLCEAEAGVRRPILDVDADPRALDVDSVSLK